jgi:hypothetical protein
MLKVQLMKIQNQPKKLVMNQFEEVTDSKDYAEKVETADAPV